MGLSARVGHSISGHIKRGKIDELKNIEKKDPKYYGEYLQLAIERGGETLEVVASMIPPTILLKNGLWPLHYAAQRGDLEAIQILKEYGAEDRKDNKGRNMLHYWAMSKATEPLKDVPYIADNEGYTPLHIAAQSGNLELVKAFLQTRDIEEETKHRETPLHLAAQHGRYEVVEHLIKEGAWIFARTRSNKTPKELAKKRGHASTVKLLQDTEYAYTRFLSAVKRGDAEAIRKRFPLYPFARDAEGNTPLHLAPNERIALWLIEQGADTTSPNIEGITPWMALKKKGFEKAAEEVLKRRNLTPIEEEYLRRWENESYEEE